MSLILFQTAPLISAEDTRQYLVWDKEGSEETVDHVCSELFKAAEGGEDPLTTQGRRGRSKKRKNKKERKSNKKKRKTSSSSPSSSSSSSSSSQEKPDSSSSSEATGDPLLIQPWENLD
jgi:hypothetical protein